MQEQFWERTNHCQHIRSAEGSGCERVAHDNTRTTRFTTRHVLLECVCLTVHRVDIAIVFAVYGWLVTVVIMPTMITCTCTCIFIYVHVYTYMYCSKVARCIAGVEDACNGTCLVSCSLPSGQICRSPLGWQQEMQGQMCLCSFQAMAICLGCKCGSSRSSSRSRSRSRCLDNRYWAQHADPNSSKALTWTPGV